ncbi:MAG: hypothetical protein V3S01_09615, partial [Dehalococcoidia bacterium]
MKLQLYPKQAEFVETSLPNALFNGGFGAGKTYALLVRAVATSAKFPHMPFGIYGPTYKALRKDMEGPMRAMLRGLGYTFEENKTDHHLRPEWCIGQESGFWFAGCDSPDSLKGPNQGGVFINEPGIISREAYDVAISRARVPLFVCADCGLSRTEMTDELGIMRPAAGHEYVAPTSCGECGSRVVECVPNPVSLAGTPEGFNWLYEEYIDEARHPDRDWSEFLVITADSRENPFIARASIDRLLDSYDAQLAREKVGGEYVNVRTGSIYYTFDRSIHVGDAYTYDPTLPLLWGLDFNVEPLCSVVCQEHQGSLWVIDEVVSPTCGRTAELVEEFARRYGSHDAGILVYGDRSGYSRDTRGGNRTDYAILLEAAKLHGLRGFDLLAARNNPARVERYARVNGLLKSAAGEVRLMFNSQGTARIVRDMEQQGYK